VITRLTNCAGSFSGNAFISSSEIVLTATRISATSLLIDIQLAAMFLSHSLGHFPDPSAQLARVRNSASVNRTVTALVRFPTGASPTDSRRGPETALLRRKTTHTTSPWGYAEENSQIPGRLREIDALENLCAHL